jgi:hypothetical protein
MFLIILDKEFELIFISGKFPHSKYHLVNLVENVRLGFKPHLEDVLWAEQGHLNYLFSKGLDIYELLERFGDQIINEDKILTSEILIHNSNQMSKVFNAVLEGRRIQQFFGNQKVLILNESYKTTTLRGRAKVFLGSCSKIDLELDSLPPDALVYPESNPLLREGTTTIAIYQKQLEESFHFVITFVDNFWQIEFLRPITKLCLTFEGADYKNGFGNERRLIPNNLNNYASILGENLIWTITEAAPQKGIYKLSWEDITKSRITADWTSSYTMVQSKSLQIDLQASFVGHHIYYF